VANQWGDFCTYCGLQLIGDFPRKCANGHFTYPSPVAVGVALQPVSVNGRIGILTVQRNINPYKGEFALPGGFVDNHETARIGAVRELSEETPIHNNIERAEYFTEASGGSHRENDPRSHAMYFYKMPVLDKIDHDFKNDEVQSLAIIFLSADRSGLENENGEKITLCFSTHHNAALKFLQVY
jgi:ADP-ribose pyrophosphatase YjhB (NUDIX family)